MSEILLFRLNSGEEIISKVIDTTSDSFTLKSPAILLPLGNGRLGLGPWLPYCYTESLVLPSKAIAFVANPKTELANEYSSSFGSGLVVPDREIQESAPSLRLITE
jgi:hypothetical protein